MLSDGFPFFFFKVVDQNLGLGGKFCVFFVFFLVAHYVMKKKHLWNTWFVQVAYEAVSGCHSSALPSALFSLQQQPLSHLEVSHLLLKR